MASVCETDNDLTLSDKYSIFYLVLK